MKRVFQRIAATRVDMETKYGFSFPDCTRSLIWAIAFGFLAALTIKDLIPLLADYTENNVATRIELVLLDENFKPPQAVIAIPYYKFVNRREHSLMAIARHLYNGTEGDCRLCTKLSEMSWDVWKGDDLTLYKALGLEAYYNALSMAFVKRLLIRMEIDDENIFDPKFLPWNEPIFSATVNFYAWLARRDYRLAPVALGPEVDSLALFYSNKTRSLEMLYSRLLMTVCKKLEFVALNYKGNNVEHRMVPDRNCESLMFNRRVPVIFDTKQIWIPLPSLESARIREYQFTFFQNTSLQRRFWDTETGSADLLPFMLFPDVGVLYVTTVDMFYSSYLFQTPLRKRAGHNVTVRYSVQLRAREARSNKHSCYNGSSATVCFTRCTKKWIMDKCGCVPFSMKTGLQYDPGSPYCSGPTYTACNISALPIEVRNSCLGKCKSACEYTSYNWHIVHQSVHTPRLPNTTQLTLKMVPMFDTFVELSWTFKNTPEQFLSQMASIANFYLGLSGLSVFAFVVTCVDFVRRIKSRAARPEDQEQEQKVEIYGMRKLSGNVPANVAAFVAQLETKLREEWTKDIENATKKINQDDR